MINKDTWINRTGFNDNTHAQNFKYICTSLKFTLNTMAAHAIVAAEPFAIKPSKVALKGGKLQISSIEDCSKSWKKVDARA